jgi:hypothetical protein
MIREQADEIMKRRSLSQWGISNPRVLLAATICLAGTLLTIISFSAGHGNVNAAVTSGTRIYVTTTAQKIGGPNTGGCSLQEAIYSSVLHNSFDGTHGIAIDATDPDHFITTDCVMGTGSGDTIVLPTGGTFNLTTYLDGDAHNPYGPTATPIIFSTMTIEGAGATLQWTGGAANVRLFAVGPASVVIKQDTLNTTVSGTGGLTLRDIYIKGFHVKGGDGGTPSGGGGLGAGGAIYVQYGALIVENSTFDSNGALGGNGAASGPGYVNGGGGGMGNNGGGTGSHGGGGGGGARGKGGDGDGGGGGGGGTVFAGGNQNNGVGGAGGYLCGGNGGDESDNGNDGRNAACAGGGGGGGGWATNPINPLVTINGGNGGYGGGGGGGGHENGGNGGFGGGGGGGTDNGGNGGFGGGGGGSRTSGNGGPFGGNGADGSGGGGGGALGGAIFNDSGSVTIHNTTFYNNSVTRGSGGSVRGFDGKIYTAPNGGDAGGAIFSHNGSVSLVDVTISGNQSTGSGGGVVVYSDSSASFIIQDTIVANNGANECFFTGNVGTSGSIGNLIMSNGSGTQPFGACTGVVTTNDPFLGPLQPPSVNGGKTPTMAIGIGSSAMGTADATTSLPFDQRYDDRPQPDRSPRNGYDIGAYEVCRRFVAGHLSPGPCGETHAHPSPPPSTTLTVQVSPTAGGTTDPTPGTHTEFVGDVIPIQATPNSDYGFRNWAGPVADATNPSTTVIMNQAQTVTANFALLRLISITRSGSNITVTFQATQGATYRLERTQSLSSPNWQSISGVNDLTPSSTGQTQITDTSGPVSLGKAFYRVRLLP